MTKWNEISSESVILAAVKANAKRTPPRTEYTVADGRGLMLVVKEKEKGQRTFTWRYQYKRPANGKTNNLTFGQFFPGGGGVGIAAAREKAQEARELVAAGVDPAEERNASRAVAQAAAAAEDEAKQRKRQGRAALGTFRAEAEDWIDYKRGTVAERTLDGYESNLKLHAYPVIGDMVLGEIRSRHLAPMNEKLMKANSLEMLNQITNQISAVFERAKDAGRCEFNPIGRISTEAKQKRAMLKGHNPAVVEPKKIGEVIAKIREYDAGTYTRVAALVAAYTMQRIGSIVAMRRADLDLDGGTWTIPPAFMKMNIALKQSAKTRAHVVPLSRQVVELLREWLARDVQPLSPWVFPNKRDAKKHAEPSATGAMMRKIGLGGTQTVHGFRATARTAGQFYADLSGMQLEAQLAHKLKGADVPDGGLPGVYARTGEFMRTEAQVAERRSVMQGWADFLDSTEQVPAEELRLVA